MESPATIETQHDPRSVAYHEAGHAVAAHSLRRGIVRVSIVADHSTDRAGYCLYYVPRFVRRYFEGPFELPEREQDVWERWVERGRARERFLDFQACLAFIAGAGPMAQTLYARESVQEGAGWDSDAETIQQAARWLFPKASARQDDYLAAVANLAGEFVQVPDNWRRIERVAEALVRRGTLSGRRVRELIAAA